MMFKVEINSNDITKAISQILGERVVLIEDKNEEGNNRIRINKINKETNLFTDNLYTLNYVSGDGRKKLILNLITELFINGITSKTDTKSTD